MLGFDTASSTQAIAPPSASDRDPDSSVAALDDGHTGKRHLLSHVITTPGAESLRVHNMRSQDGEVEGRPPYLHVGLAFFSRPGRAELLTQSQSACLLEG